MDQDLEQLLHRMEMEIKRHTDFAGPKPMQEFSAIHKALKKALEKAPGGLPKGALGPEDVEGAKDALKGIQEQLRVLESRLGGGPVKAAGKSPRRKKAIEGQPSLLE